MPLSGQDPTHCFSDIPSHRSTERNSCHHRSRIKSTATIQAYTTCAISTHFAQRSSASDTDFSLLLDLKCTHVNRLRLFMLGILSLFALNTQPPDIVCCFSMNFCRSNILCDCHKLMVAITCLVNLNCGNIKAGDKNAKIFLQTFANVMFNCAVDLCGFAFNLNDRYTVFGRGIRHAVFHISADSVTNLLLEIIKTETAESMQLDKSSVI